MNGVAQVCRGLKARDPGRRDAPGTKVLKKRRLTARTRSYGDQCGQYRTRLIVPAADEQREERKPASRRPRREPRDERVRFHVMHRHDRKRVLRAQLLRGDDADAKAHREPGPHSHGHRGEARRIVDSRATQRLRDDRVDRALVRVPREVRDDAAPPLVDLHLLRERLAEDAAVAGDDRGAGVVARRLDAEYEGVGVDARRRGRRRRRRGADAEAEALALARVAVAAAGGGGGGGGGGGRGEHAARGRTATTSLPPTRFRRRSPHRV